METLPKAYKSNDRSPRGESMSISKTSDQEDKSHKHNNSKCESDDRRRESSVHAERKRRNRSRWERKSEDRQVRSRGSSSLDAASCSNKNQPPNTIILLQHLPCHITESDIRNEIIRSGLMAKDIRLIRKKDTGASKGYAFVEFTLLKEAVQWMEMKQGVLILQNKYRATMNYSVHKEKQEEPPSDFQKRDKCYSCNASRVEGGSNEICNYTTKTIMLRNLDTLTTEESVMSVLNIVIPELVKTISGVCIGRDPFTATSRGICYLGTESLVDSLRLYGALSNLPTPLSIDGKTAQLAYCKYYMGDMQKADEAAFPNASGISDVEKQTEYSDCNQFYAYLKNQTDAANANASFYETTRSIPSGTDGKLYPIPDVTKYTHDINTGYQYDPTTCLYYDSTSKYYWNGVIQKYMYYDPVKLTYLLAPTTCENPQEPHTKKLKLEEISDNKLNSKCTGVSANVTLKKPATAKKKSTNDNAYLDFTKLMCNLCTRQFKTAAVLRTHSKLSVLHKMNLEAKRDEKNRAVEDKLNCGDSKDRQRDDVKLQDAPASTSSVVKSDGTENVGKKLMEKMGWTEGQGLGKSNQGRTTIVEVEKRCGKVGLGNTVSAGKVYPKKMKFLRYKDQSKK